MHYTAKELVDMLNLEEGEALTVRKVRYYAQMDLLSPPQLVNGKKKYTGKHLEELRAIRNLQQTGSSLEKIKKEITDLDAVTLSRVSENAMYLSEKPILDKNVQELNEDVALLFSQRVTDEMRNDMIHAIQTVLNNHKGEL